MNRVLEQHQDSLGCDSHSVGRMSPGGGCDHRTVARYVKMRAAGQNPGQRRHRSRKIDDLSAFVLFQPCTDETLPQPRERVHNR